MDTILPLPGLQGGSCSPGPVRTEIRLPGQSQVYRDESLGWNPRQRIDYFQDFVGHPDEYQLTVNAGQIGTAAGAYSGFTAVPRAGVIVGIDFVGEDTLAVSDTNYITFSAANRLASGSGTTALLAATDPNTTKSTGGAAVTAKARRALTLSATAAALYVAAGDVLEAIGTVTGTADNEVDDATFVIKIRTLPRGLYPRITRTAGSPLAGIVDDTANGEAKFETTATNEAQVSGFDWEDQLLIPATRRPVVAFRLKHDTITTAQRAVWGLASAYNATFDSVTSNLWFRLQAAMDLLVEGDDGTTDTDDSDTGENETADTYAIYVIDARDLSAVRFYKNDRLLSTVAVSALTVSSLLQIVGWLQKDSGTGAVDMVFDWIRASWDRE